MNALVAVWRHCRICEVTSNAHDAGPPQDPKHGWYLTLRPKDHAHD